MLTKTQESIGVEFNHYSSNHDAYLDQACSCNYGPSWPFLDELHLAREFEFVRRAGVGGSDANTILSGDEQRIMKLWGEKRGESEAEDLSAVLPVMLGSWTEAFNRQWFERETGNAVSRVGVSFNCPIEQWRRCTLDGFIEKSGAVFEAKHVNAFAKGDEIVARYMPQLQHNMAVVQSETAILSVIFGNHKWECYEIAADWLYQEELLAAESCFWECVKTGKPPVPAPVPSVPLPIGTREVCLQGNNAWADAAAEWLQTRDFAKRYKSATITLKDLVEADVARAYGHGVEAKRNKAGSISIRECGA